MFKESIFKITKEKKINTENQYNLLNKQNKFIKIWSQEEDEKLISISKKMKRNKWKYAASFLSEKTSNDCYRRSRL